MFPRRNIFATNGTFVNFLDNIKKVTSWPRGKIKYRHDMAESRVIRLTIPAKPEYIALGRLTLAGISRVQPVPDETLADLKLALTEACTNSVRHAYSEGGSGTVEIVFELESDRLAVEVVDEGGGFDVAEPMEPGEPSESGLGIAIIRALADDFEVTEGESGGSRLRFAKQLTGQT
jgi:serine/threonine-protein kinase RsbW